MKTHGCIGKSLGLLFSFFIIFSFRSFVSAQGLSSPLGGKTIHIVDDAAEWPPYVYYERVGGKPSDRITGFSVDVIAYIFGKHGIDYTIELLPWKRALLEVRDGSRLDMVLNATLSDERERTYLVSLPYYTTHEYCFFSRKNFPNGLTLDSKEDLKKYRIVGMRGWNFSHFGLGPRDIYEVDSFESVLALLRYGRFDCNPTSYEGMIGQTRLNPKLEFGDEVGFLPVPGMPPLRWYMMFTKNETGKALKALVDRELTEMRGSGILAELLKKHGLLAE